MIELRNINRTYNPKKGEPVRALKNINLKFGDTGMVFVLGKSGSGKSTLLNVIGGLDKYDDGDLIIQGKSSRDFKQSDFDSYRNTMIGFIFQEYNVLDEFTVAQNIALALQLQGRKATNEAINDILDSVDLSGYARRKPNELSGGQKQRVAIARALVKEPKVIMADEPTGALDSVTGTQVLETLQELSKSRLVIVVSHDREYAETYGDRVIEFADGEIISDVTRKPISEAELKEKPLKFTASAVSVKQGYELTEEDLKVINNYLKRSKADSSIEKIFNQAAFIQTNEKEIEMSRDHYHSIKSKLPFKTSLRIGASALKNKTFRLFISILLASVAFAMFALADTMGSYDKVEVTAQSMLDSNVDYIALDRTSIVDYGDWSTQESLGFNDVDITNLNNKYNNKLNFKGIHSDRNTTLSINENLYDSIGSSDYIYYDPSFSGMIEFSQNDISNFSNGLTGRLPATDSEIVITKHTLDTFTKFGYRDLNNPTVKVPIPAANSILNRELRINNAVYTVVGVLDTNFNSERYEAIKTAGTGITDYLLITEYQTVMNYSYHKLLIVNNGFINSLESDDSIDFGNSHYISVFDNVNTRDYYSNNIAKVDIANYSKYTFFSNASMSGENDLIVTKDLFWEELMEATQEYHAYAQDYITSLSDQVIYDALVEDDYTPIKPISEWNVADRNIYNDYFYYDYYYYDINNEVASPLPKTNIDLMDELIADYFANFAPVNVEITITNYYSNETLELDGRIVGYYEPDLYSGWTYIVTNDFYDNLDLRVPTKYSSAIASFDGSDEDLLMQISADSYTVDNNNMSYELKNEVMATLNQVNNMIEMLAEVFFYVGIGFVVFAALLLINYITISISYKKKEIGILRAIGARGNDVVGIFFKEAMIIALINFLIATTMAVGTILYLNNLMRNEYGILITILNFGVRQIVLMLLVSVFIAFISSSIPVSRVARKRPIDAIRDK